MPKRDLRRLMLHEFKLGHNVSETSANIRVWGDGSTNNGRGRWQRYIAAQNSLVYIECRNQILKHTNKYN